MTTETLLSGQAPTSTGEQQVTDAQAASAVEPVENEAQGADAPAAEGQQEAEPVVPETYEFQLPEGFELNQEVSTEFQAFAKDLKLPQDKAQQAVDFAVKLQQQTLQAQVDAHVKQVADWRAEVEADKEIGGKALPENLSYAAKVLDEYAPDLRAVLDQTGMGNHPVLVKALIRIGKAISEDRLVGGAQQASTSAQDPAKRMFPNMN